MALTRKMLLAMDIPAEKIDEIMTAHTETLNEIKSERDQLKTDVEELKKKEQEFTTASTELAKLKSGDWENKYNTLKGEFDTYKTDIQTKETKAAKETAYRKLLEKAGVSAKRIESVLKVSGSAVEGLKIDKDGNIEDADKLIESVKTEWADFIATTHEEGANVANPPANNGGEVKKPSRASELVAKYRNEHYGNPEKED